MLRRYAASHPPTRRCTNERAQEDESEAGALVHAYLHRKEGDAGNAAYWYRRARRDPAEGSFQAEWRRIAEALLKQES